VIGCPARVEEGARYSSSQAVATPLDLQLSGVARAWRWVPNTRDQERLESPNKTHARKKPNAVKKMPLLLAGPSVGSHGTRSESCPLGIGIPILLVGWCWLCRVETVLLFYERDRDRQSKIRTSRDFWGRGPNFSIEKGTERTYMYKPSAIRLYSDGDLAIVNNRHRP
jgi:hypothetical protein